MRNSSFEFRKRCSSCAIRIVVVAAMAMIASLPQTNHVMAQSDCAALQNQLHGLNAAKRRLQKSLQKAAGEDKVTIVQQIREMESEILEVQRKLGAMQGHEDDLDRGRVVTPGSSFSARV